MKAATKSISLPFPVRPDVVLLFRGAGRMLKVKGKMDIGKPVWEDYEYPCIVRYNIHGIAN